MTPQSGAKIGATAARALRGPEQAGHGKEALAPAAKARACTIPSRLPWAKARAHWLRAGLGACAHGADKNHSQDDRQARLSIRRARRGATPQWIAGMRKNMAGARDFCAAQPVR